MADIGSGYEVAVEQLIFQKGCVGDTVGGQLGEVGWASVVIDATQRASYPPWSRM